MVTAMVPAELKGVGSVFEHALIKVASDRGCFRIEIHAEKPPEDPKDQAAREAYEDLCARLCKFSSDLQKASGVPVDVVF